VDQPNESESPPAKEGEKAGANVEEGGREMQQENNKENNNNNSEMEVDDSSTAAGEVAESRSEEPVLFAKDQNLLTEKEFEPIYD